MKINHPNQRSGASCLTYERLSATEERENEKELRGLLAPGYSPRLSSPLSSLPSPRRGVLLLIVLALLALFGLVAVAFVVVTSQARRSAKSIERVDQVIDPPPKLLQQAMMQVLRGPYTNPNTDPVTTAPNPASVMGAHSLLEDIYGNRWMKGTATITGASGQVISFTFAQATGATTPAIRTGCVVTVVEASDTKLIGQSSRIVASNFAAAPTYEMLAFDVPTQPTSGTMTVVINGVPFSGTGFGYDNTGAAAAQITVGTVTGPAALCPNDTANRTPAGGANSDYTAADFQHMLLAAQVYNTVSSSVQTLPSMHRPALVRYWMNQNGITDWTTPNAWGGLTPSQVTALRQISMRPIGSYGTTTNNDADHPEFTGSNPNFNPAWDGVTANQGQWDVDNDGDGVPDSVWVDLGMPARATSDGRLYKPLFAILCTDLDGRINLNAHGSAAQTDTAYYQGVQPQLPVLGSLAGVTAGSTVTLPRGVGYGPADINPNYVLSANPTTDVATYQQVLGVNGVTSGYEGRYGSDRQAGVAGTLGSVANNYWFNYAGDDTTNSGISYWWGFLSSLNYVRDAYGSPPDPWGTGAVGLDVAGRPLYMTTTGDTTRGPGGSVVNNPYKINLGANVSRGTSSGSDNLFSLTELERILRPFDRDATTLPGRLATLASILTTNPAKRLEVTTESWDLPCPAVRLGQRLADKLNARNIPQSEWANLLPPELLVGLKMDINRPFGNGRVSDSSANPGVVDLPTAGTNQSVTLSGNAVTSFSFDGMSGAGSPTTSLQARQLEARYLYVLLCMTCEPSAVLTRLGVGATYDDVARFFAQWAINVVAAKTRDSIIIPFVYNPHVADPGYSLTAGWNAATYHLGLPLPADTCVVWSCKRPELLITETLAFHDRKTKDTADDPTHKAISDGDTDFDQIETPEGSLFVELYNPSSCLEPPVDATDKNVPLKVASGMGGQNRYASAVRLDQTTPSGDPVWRLLVTIPATSGDANDKNDPDDPSSPPTSERSVYFVKASPTTITDVSTKFHRATSSTDIAPIQPGRYAVVGPGDTTYVGKEIGATGVQDSGTRQIDLTPSSTVNTANQVKVINTTAGASDAATAIKPPVAIVVDRPRRLSVSEPTGGYNPVPADSPFDVSRSDLNTAMTWAANGTTPSYRIIHLQRLANPRAAWNATTNPYVTIDSQPVDLTVFNGNIPSTTTEPGITTLDPNTLMFASHQRGETNTSTDGVNNLWKVNLTAKSVTDSQLADQLGTANGEGASDTHHHNFPFKLYHTLGYLNTRFGTPTLDRASDTDPTSSSNGWLSTRGDPPDANGPFPWLTWNGRPYATPLELLQVPWLRQSQWLRKFKVAQTGTPYTTAGVPFPHLLNMFLSGTPSSPDEELFRVLEYLRVPSPFVGTETWTNPGTGFTASPYFPPFNRISAFREPGKINLNAIYSPEVFNGLMNGVSTATWAEFVQSRRGDPAPGAGVLDAPAVGCPTEFSHPFRSFSGASLPQSVASLTPSREINGTMLRESPTLGRPLFQPATPPANAYNDASRNPYFRYQAIERLGNLVTTRSNVYAVWITVGYFEVTPVAIDAGHPDGYKLGRELGTDTGEIERHRAFYIIDRTIPVGFQRGQDLNAEKAILINRFIE